MPKAKKLEWKIESEVDLRPKMMEVWQMTQKGIESDAVIVTLSRPARTLDQNAKLWPMLTDVSNQVVWYGEKYSPDDWKNILTAGLVRQRVVQGIEGGVVMLGLSTSRMNKQTFSDLIELIYAFGADNGVQWSEKAQGCYDNYREASSEKVPALQG
jgi:hypothetical protein